MWGRVDFCGSTCRAAFHNRRKKRGAILYDLYMAHRFERDEAKALNVLSMMNRLASRWREQDERDRGKRKSWRSIRDVLPELVWARADVIVPRRRR